MAKTVLGETPVPVALCLLVYDDIGVSGVKVLVFLTLVVEGMGWLASCSVRFISPKIG